MKKYNYILILSAILFNLSAFGQGLTATSSQNATLTSDISNLENTLKATSDSIVNLKGTIKSKLASSSITTAKSDSLKVVYKTLDAVSKNISNFWAHYEAPGSDQPVNDANKYLVAHKKQLLVINRQSHAEIKHALKHVTL
jgi:hypothetical protein